MPGPKLLVSLWDSQEKLSDTLNFVLKEFLRSCVLIYKRIFDFLFNLENNISFSSVKMLLGF